MWCSNVYKMASYTVVLLKKFAAPTEVSSRDYEFCLAVSLFTRLCNAIIDAFFTMKYDWKVLGHFPLGRDVCHIVFCPFASERFLPRLGREEGLRRIGSQRNL